MITSYKMHVFQTENEFDSAYNGSGYTEPWVSYTRDTKEVNYNKIPVPPPPPVEYTLNFKQEYLRDGSSFFFDYQPNRTLELFDVITLDDFWNGRIYTFFLEGTETAAPNFSFVSGPGTVEIEAEIKTGFFKRTVTVHAQISTNSGDASITIGIPSIRDEQPGWTIEEITIVEQHLHFTVRGGLSRNQYDLYIEFPYRPE